MYSFAHLLYEMLCGEPLRSSFLQDVPQNCPSQLSKCCDFSVAMTLADVFVKSIPIIKDKIEWFSIALFTVSFSHLAYM